MILPISGLYVLGMSFVVLRQNPRRWSHRAFFAFGCLVAVWFTMVQLAGQALAHFQQGLPTDPVPWLRGNAIAAAFMCWLIALTHESIRLPHSTAPQLLRRTFPWLLIGVAMALLCLVKNFVREISTPRGGPYYVYCLIGLVSLIILIRRIAHQIPSLPAGRRIEAQFMAMVPALSMLFCVIANSIANYFMLPAFKRLFLPVLIGCFSLVVWVLNSKRVYEARQIFLSVGQRVLLACGVSASIIGFWYLFRGFAVTFPAELAAGAGILITLVLWFDRKTRRWLGLDSADILADLRQEILDLARNEPRAEMLQLRFEQMLSEKCRAATSHLFRHDHSHRGPPSVLSPGNEGFAALAENGWITPELLERRRGVPAVKDLSQFMAENNFGLLVATPRNGPNPLFIALGAKTDGWPYTFPEILRIQQAAELMENLLTQSRLTAQIALKSRIEHLSMMSRGLAHDLKNLITPISSFLVHSEPKVAPGTAEEEVHATAKRSVRIMNDYIREALFFANRLEPRFESVSTGKIFDAVREVTATRANRRQVKLVIAHESDHALVADAVLLQRMLGNLVCNAIDASSPGRIVTISAVPSHARTLRISVVDQGSGIAPQHLSRIFEPYFTTKEFGDDVRGFGLGLTISQKIVHLHHGTISVQSQLGCGTAVTIDLPVAQPQPATQMTEHTLAEQCPVP